MHNKRLGYLLLQIIIFLIFLGCSDVHDEPTIVADKPPGVADDSPPDEFNSLYFKVRDGLISKEDAVKQINDVAIKLTKYFNDKGGTTTVNGDWVFPLRNYTPNAIGGTNGSGYVTSGYDFFDGNKHGGHPAHDIFIHDINQDCIDDNTGQPVDVLSMSSGVVVSLEKNWAEDSDLRGGNFVMIYDPFSNAIFYYAHNNVVTINVGDIVKAGDKIAEVGRSGLNAFKKRSPTHLHISFFLVGEGDVKPDDIYRDLVVAKVVN